MGYSVIWFPMFFKICSFLNKKQVIHTFLVIPLSRLVCNINKFPHILHPPFAFDMKRMFFYLLCTKNNTEENYLVEKKYNLTLRSQ